MIKNIFRNLCQKLLGFDNYLFIFSLLNIARIRVGIHEKTFRYFAGIICCEGAILDIGANVGMMTVILAKKFPRATIFSFEPMTDNRKALERIVHFFHLKNVRIFPQALGNENTQVVMTMPVAGGSRMQGFSHVVESVEGEPGNLFPATIQRMDDMPELLSLKKICALKIDVENFEYFVLKGGELLLKKHRPIILCELWNNDRRSLCFQFMRSLGYRIAILERDKLVYFNGQEALDFFFLPYIDASIHFE